MVFTHNSSRFSVMETSLLKCAQEMRPQVRRAKIPTNILPRVFVDLATVKAAFDRRLCHDDLSSYTRLAS